MAKKRANNISKHIKTRHKKPLSKRTLTNMKVDPAIRNINKAVTQAVEAQEKLIKQNR